MNDLHGKLDRLADRVGDRPAPDLHSARDRHERRRTRSAMTVGLVVAIAAGALVVSALPSSDSVPQNGGSGQPAAWVLPDPITVWPESPVTAETPEEAQARVDAGEDQWRLDPEQVVRRFVGDILGWTEPQVSTTQPGLYEVLPEECPPNARCYPGIGVTAIQPLGDGIWSVAAISHPDLMIDVPVADPEVGLMGGSEITFDLTLPADRTAHLGMVAANDCAQIAAAAIGLESGPATLTIPEAGRDDPNCSDIGAGYVYVYAMDDTTEPAEADPISMPAAIELPYLTVVPIYVQTETGETATTTPEPSTEPDVLAVSCYGDPTTQLDATEVAAAPDGVHLLVRSTNAYVEVQIDDDFIRIEDSPRELVLDLAPGEHGVQCIAPGADQVWDPSPFEVVDPNGYWLDPSVDCAPPADIVDLDADVITVEGDPLDELLAVGESILGDELSEDGEATMGGYPESLPDRTVIMVNEDGSVLGRANFRVADEGWYIDSWVTCEGQTIT